MPKQWAMAQISRPFQIAFLGVVLLAGVWLFALHGHSQSSEPGASASPSATPAPAAKAATAPTYHGSAPGVAGLSNAVAKAQGAVATSQQNAKQLELKSAQASDPSAPGASAAAPGAAAPAGHSAPAARAIPTTKPATKAATPAHALAPPKAAVAPARPATSGAASANAVAIGAHARQRAVESELSSGNVVLVLFWDHRGADDVAVQRAVQAVAHSERKVSVQEAKADEVAAFGSITKGVQVYGTPTLLVVGKQGQTVVITGLTDSYVIRQAASEVRSS
jgi:hypothetical protein